MSCETCLFGVTLQPHQLEVCKYFINNNSLMCYHETGTGKTITALSSICFFLSNNPTKFAWITCPSALIDQWSEKITYLLPRNIQPRIRVLSHEKFLNDIQSCWYETDKTVFIHSRYAGTVQCSQLVKDVIDKLFLVVDESHLVCQKIKFDKFGLCTEGKKSLALRYASNFICSKLLLLTATPIKNHFDDLIPPLECLMIIDDKDIDFLRIKIEKDKCTFVKKQPDSLLVTDGSRTRLMNGIDLGTDRKNIFQKLGHKIHYMIRHENDPCYPKLEFHNIIIQIDINSQYYKNYKNYVDRGYLNYKLTSQKDDLKKTVKAYDKLVKKNELSSISSAQSTMYEKALKQYSGDPHRGVNTNIYDGEILNEFCIYYPAIPDLFSTPKKNQLTTINWLAPLELSQKDTAKLGNRLGVSYFDIYDKKGLHMIDDERTRFFKSIDVPLIFSPKIDFLIGQYDRWDTFIDLSPFNTLYPGTLIDLSVTKSVIFVMNTNTLIPILYKILHIVYPTTPIFIICGNPKVIRGLTFNRDEEMIRYNRAATGIMLLTSAGAQGVDLKGTNNIFFLERPFSYTDIRQIIGRGQRLFSHKDLPRNRQIVKIYNFFIRDPTTKILFGSDLVSPIIEKKRKEQDAFESDLRVSCGIQLINDQFMSYLPKVGPRQVENDCLRFKTFQQWFQRTKGHKLHLRSKLFGFINTNPL